MKPLDSTSIRTSSTDRSSLDLRETHPHAVVPWSLPPTLALSGRRTHLGSGSSGLSHAACAAGALRAPLPPLTQPPTFGIEPIPARELKGGDPRGVTDVAPPTPIRGHQMLLMSPIRLMRRPSKWVEIAPSSSPLVFLTAATTAWYLGYEP